MNGAYERFDSLSLPRRIVAISAMAGLAILGMRTIDADGTDRRVYSNNIIDSVICSGHEKVMLKAGTPLSSLAEQKGYTGSLAYIYVQDSMKQIDQDSIGASEEGEAVVTKDTLATLAESCD